MNILGIKYSVRKAKGYFPGMSDIDEETLVNELSWKFHFDPTNWTKFLELFGFRNFYNIGYAFLEFKDENDVKKLEILLNSDLLINIR